MIDFSGHSHIGASSASRWLACPGSVALYQQITRRKATIYAATGTVAHELCERCLTGNTEPLDYLGMEFEQDGFIVKVDDAMVSAVTMYVGRIRHDLQRFGGTLKVEQSFDLSWVYPGMYGRNDACIIPDDLFGILRVYDYKNGRTNVDAKHNPQLMYYALGALGQHNLNFVEVIEVNIIQPNASDGGDWIDTWVISVDELYAWANDVLRPGAELTARPDAPLNEGDHCTFCEAAAFCPRKQSKVLAMFDAPVEAAPAEIVLPKASALEPERIGLLSAFFNGPEFDAWRKSLAAEEQAMLSRGVRIPGRKLVETVVKGNRRWVSEDAVITALKDELGEEMFSSSLKSPAQIERLLTGKGVAKQERTELISPLVTRDETIKTIVVSENDSRAAIADRRDKALEMFAN